MRRRTACAAACALAGALIGSACSSGDRTTARAGQPGSPGDRARLDELLQSGRIAVATVDGCTEWAVTLERMEDGTSRGLLRRDVRPGNGCVGTETRRVELIGPTVRLHAPTAEGRCSNGKEYVGGSLCGGPYVWRVTSSTGDSVTIALARSRHRERWFRDLATCRASPRVAVAGGC